MLVPAVFVIQTDEMYERHRVVGGRPRYEREDRGFETSCWIWRMWVEPTGYAYCKAWGGRAHRGLYKLLVRDPGPSIELHHRCEQKDCVNPWHLGEMAHGEHQRMHLTGRKMELSDAERVRRREHGRKMGKRNVSGLYTKQTRSDVGKRRHAQMTPEQKEAWKKALSDGWRKKFERESQVP